MTACRFPGAGNKAPAGQVVATVDGQEITYRELSKELAGVQVSDPKIRKSVEQQALQAIINRKIMAREAKVEGIDKEPDYALERTKLVELLLARKLQDKVAAAVPATTREEAERFVLTHPNQFAQRRIFRLDQIRVNGGLDQAKLRELQPLNSLEEVEAYLKKNNIPYTRGPSELNALNIAPELLDAMLKLPPNELFVLPSAQTVLINRIADFRVDPLTGEAAIQLAMQALGNQHVQEAVGKQTRNILQQAHVSYNPAFAPAKSRAAAPVASSAPSSAASSAPPAPSASAN